MVSKEQHAGQCASNSEASHKETHGVEGERAAFK